MALLLTWSRILLLHLLWMEERFNLIHKETTIYLPYCKTVTGTPQTPVSVISARALHYHQVAFKQLENYQPGRNHIVIPVVVEDKKLSYCKYKKCPGLDSAAKRLRAYPSKYICEQCTMEKGSDFWLCHSIKKVGGIHLVVDCHTAYHVDINSIRQQLHQAVLVNVLLFCFNR